MTGAPGETRPCREAAVSGRCRGVRRPRAVGEDRGRLTASRWLRHDAARAAREQLAGDAGGHQSRCNNVARREGFEHTLRVDVTPLPWGSQARREPSRRGGRLAYGRSILRVGRVGAAAGCDNVNLQQLFRKFGTRKCTVARRRGLEPPTVGSEVLVRFNADSVFQGSPSPILAHTDAVIVGFGS